MKQNTKPEKPAPSSGLPSLISVDPEKFAYTALLEGNTVDELEEALTLAGHGKQKTQILEKVRVRFRQVAREDEDAIAGWAMASARDLARKMQQIGDYAGALKALKLVHDIARSRKESWIDA